MSDTRVWPDDYERVYAQLDPSGYRREFARQEKILLRKLKGLGRRLRMHHRQAKLVFVVFNRCMDPILDGHEAFPSAVQAIARIRRALPCQGADRRRSLYKGDLSSTDVTVMLMRDYITRRAQSEEM